MHAWNRCYRSVLRNCASHRVYTDFPWRLSVLPFLDSCKDRCFTTNYRYFTHVSPACAAAYGNSVLRDATDSQGHAHQRFSEDRKEIILMEVWTVVLYRSNKPVFTRYVHTRHLPFRQVGRSSKAEQLSLDIPVILCYKNEGSIVLKICVFTVV